MQDRYRRNRHENFERGYEERNRQPEQFQSDDEQLGEARDRYRAQSRRWDRDYAGPPEQSDRGPSVPGDYDPLGDYDRDAAGYRSDAYRRSQAPTHRSFRPDDYGGEDYTRGSYRGAGGTRASRMTGGGYGASVRDHGYARDDDRGFFERAGDEVASWFGDEEAERRRRLDHRGRGPANYRRSDERLLEDACERLTEDRALDARGITVTVADGEVTLDGTVDSRRAKRRAEDCVHDIAGVGHVQNNLRISEDESRHEFGSDGTRETSRSNPS